MEKKTQSATPVSLQTDTADLRKPVNPRRQSIIPPDIKKFYSDFGDHDEGDHTERYKMGSLLGSGAFGQIFSAFDRNIGRQIAIKSPHPDALKDQNKLDFFMHEARITAALQHPNIVPVYDLDTDNSGRPYFTMRQIEGTSLGAAIDQAASGQIPAEIRTFSSRVGIILKVIDAVAYVHNCGIIHQDIKPDNIMLGKFGEVMLTDWGTACYAVEYPEGRMLGTPLFMPPEQAQHHPVGVANDIYSLGATFYNLLTLQYPMDDSDSDRFWDKKFAGAFDALPPEVERRVPRPLLDIARKAMAVRISDRYSSAMEMAKDLRNYLEGAAVSAHHYSIRETFSRNVHRHRKNFIPYLGLMVLAVSLLLLWWREKSREDRVWRDNVPIALSRENIPEWREHCGAQTVPPGGKNSVWRWKNNKLWGEIPAAVNYSEASVLQYSPAVYGDLRVSFTLIPLSLPLKFACFIDIGNRTRFYGHLGGAENPGICALTAGREKTWLDARAMPQPWEPLKAHRVTMEYSAGLVKVQLDGKTVSEYADTLTPPATWAPQTFGFRLAGGSVCVYGIEYSQQPLAAKISPLTAADALWNAGKFSAALTGYEKIAEDHRQKASRLRAEWRGALCLDALDRPEESSARREQFLARAEKNAPELRDALIHNAKEALNMEKMSEWDKNIGMFAAAFPGDSAGRTLVEHYSRYLRKKTRLTSLPMAELTQGVMDCLGAVRTLAGRLGIAEKAITVDLSGYAEPLLLAGLPETVAHIFAGQKYWEQRALCQMGDYGMVAADKDYFPDYAHAEALLFCRRADEARKKYPYFLPAYLATGDWTAARQNALTARERFGVALLADDFTALDWESLSVSERAIKETVENSAAFRTTLSRIPPALSRPAESAVMKNILETAARGEKSSLNAVFPEDFAEKVLAALDKAAVTDLRDKNVSPEFSAWMAAVLLHSAGREKDAKALLARLDALCRAFPYRYDYLLPLCEYVTGALAEERLWARMHLLLPHEQQAISLLARGWEAQFSGDIAAARRYFREWLALPPARQTRYYAHLPYLIRFCALCTE